MRTDLFISVVVFILIVFNAYDVDSNQLIGITEQSSTEILRFYAQDNGEKDNVDNENSKSTKQKVDNGKKQNEQNKEDEKNKTIIIKSNPIQFCRGKYEKLGDTGFEIITVMCPSVEDLCICEIDIKAFREYVMCGGVRKNASKGSDIKDCESVIIGN